MLALIAIDPMVASVAAVGFGASYVLITWMSRRRLHRNSQRIARALYKQASVLVFDAATSALDNATELSVMDAIEGLSSDLTILIIAHRLSTVQRCDIIVELEYGRVLAQDTYEQLIERNRSMQASKKLKH